MSGGDLFSKMEYANDSADANKLNAIYAANPSVFELPEEAKDANSKDCSSSSPVDFLYLSTIRGGRKMSLMSGGCGCAMKGGGDSGDSDDSGYTGGCFTCKKGERNIVNIYSTLHIVVPPLYKKYKKWDTLKKTRT